jgi:hypothetical protein
MYIEVINLMNTVDMIIDNKLVSTLETLSNACGDKPYFEYRNINNLCNLLNRKRASVSAKINKLERFGAIHRENGLLYVNIELLKTIKDTLSSRANLIFRS